MIKHLLLASAVMISAPAFAQDAPAQDSKPATRQQTPPPADTAEPAPSAEPGTPAEPAAPADPATPAQPASPSDESATPATPAEPATPATPATPEQPNTPDQTAQTAPSQQPAAPGGQQAAKQPATATQIATIVDQGFPSYDKDADGSLKTEEFGAWMVALRSASEPAFTGQSVADKEWIGKAAQVADADKSGSVSKAELKGFLAPQPAAS